jgi:cell shape-determining protein MreC|tara:strand:+ start:89 stop:319 length:231 start_codon:yes stop_codon:yes gene_type:complete
MKENKLIEMSNKVKALTNVAQHLLNEVANIRELSVGTLETIKQMPDYVEAIEKLKTKLAEESSKAEEAKSLEATSD